MDINQRPKRIDLDGCGFDICRTTGGVMQVSAETMTGLGAGLGYAHATDRLVQMMLVRLIGQGRLSECLQATADTLAIDTFMRELGVWRDVQDDASQVEGETLAHAEAYARGVNARLQSAWRPLEFLLVGYRPEPWTPADTLLTIKIMGYVGLAQGQQDVEKLIVQSLRADVPIERLQALFTPHLDGITEEVVGALKELRYLEPLVPDAIRFAPALPTLRASNSWVIGPGRSKSGNAIAGDDIHLECNRLPAVWCEAVLRMDDRFWIGATMPGVPGMVMGRNRDVSYAFTYGFMDMIDYVVEECRGGKVRRGDDFVPIDPRTETIQRKGSTPVKVRVWETEHGVLEVDNTVDTLDDGYYLCRAWSCHRHGASASLTALCRMMDVDSVEEAQKTLRHMTISANWTLADRAGNIGYQQSGRLPNRRHSGLYPVPGWKSDLTWSGLVDPDALMSELNPEAGFIASANNEIRRADGPLSVNMSQGHYRFERLRSLIGARKDWTAEDARALQEDFYSPQAERFMEVLRRLLPETSNGKILESWDCRYGPESVGGALFDRLHAAINAHVFGALFGSEAWQHLVEGTAMMADYFQRFDDALLGDDPAWWGAEGREVVLRRVAESTLAEGGPSAKPAARRQVMMNNIFFEGRMPGWLGFDHGPIQLPGSSSTIVQTAIFNAHGRQTTFFPSWRFVSDLGSDVASTVLAGGPSGRRFSKHYKTDIDLWRAHGYKMLRGGS